MKRIPLTQGQFALVDDDDFDWLMLWKWHAHWDTRNWYAQRMSPSHGGKRKTIRMHAVIAGFLGADHKNRNTLDNQRHNLRKASASEQGMNRDFSSINTTGCRGVTWRKRDRCWSAQIRFKGRLKFLGHFADKELAKKAYDTAAKELFGEFANL